LDPITSAFCSPTWPSLDWRASSPDWRATSICRRTIAAQPSGCAVSEMKPRMRGSTTSCGMRTSRSRRAPCGRGCGASVSACRGSLVAYLEHSHECFLRHLDGAEHLPALLAGLLLFEQLAFARDVAAVALREHVLAHRLH